MVTSITFETVEAARRLLTAAGYTPVSVGVRKFRTPTGTVQVPVVTGLRGPDNWFPDARDIFVGDQIAPDEGGGGGSRVRHPRLRRRRRRRGRRAGESPQDGEIQMEGHGGAQSRQVTLLATSVQVE